MGVCCVKTGHCKTKNLVWCVHTSLHNFYTPYSTSSVNLYYIPDILSFFSYILILIVLLMYFKYNMCIVHTRGQRKTFIYVCIGDLAKAVRNRTDLHFGLYHSLFEWFNPLYLADKANNFRTTEFVEVCCVIANCY